MHARSFVIRATSQGLFDLSFVMFEDPVLLEGFAVC